MNFWIKNKSKMMVLIKSNKKIKKENYLKRKPRLKIKQLLMNHKRKIKNKMNRTKKMRSMLKMSMRKVDLAKAIKSQYRLTLSKAKNPDSQKKKHLSNMITLLWMIFSDY